MTTARSSATARSAQALGRRGEDAAARYLEASGMVVLSRNWRCRDGELDLVATDGTLLVIAEVKTRSGRGYGDPAEAITAVKAGRIRRVSMAWLRAHQVGWCDIRFDVLSVLCPPGGEPTIDHLVGAF